MTPIEKTAKAISDSALLTAAGRLVTILLVPAVLAVGGWAATEILNLGKRMEVTEVRQVATRTEILGRVESLEAHDRSDAAANIELIRKIAILETGQNFMLKSLERIETATGARR